MRTNNVINMVLSGTNGQPTPKVGMGITIMHWTDRSAGTITRVSPSGKMFWFRPDDAIRIDKNGMSESQDYRYTPDLDATEQTARLNKRGAWMTAGRHVRVGDRRAYHDFSF